MSTYKFELEYLYEDLKKYKKEADGLRAGIAVYSEIREENLDYKEKADSLKRLINKCENELMIVLIKCAFVELMINREEMINKEKQNNC